LLIAWRAEIATVASGWTSMTEDMEMEMDMWCDNNLLLLIIEAGWCTLKNCECRIAWKRFGSERCR
jgi:hypothetical protein